MAGDTVFIEAIGGQGEGRDTALLSQGSRPGQGTAAVLLDVFGRFRGHRSSRRTFSGTQIFSNRTVTSRTSRSQCWAKTLGDTVFTEAIRRNAFIPVYTRRVSPLWTRCSICIAADQNHPWNLLISSKMLCPGGPRQTQQERASGMPARAGDQEH